jgi:hypothetical protein
VSKRYASGPDEDSALALLDATVNLRGGIMNDVGVDPAGMHVDGRDAGAAQLMPQ